ncbi:uncharacterized protein [Amphiura filiformis]|uniref:uncharacterized protein n=1 Tax=Amphiura filiformis TaxID=82378 RepID=UPI003B2274D9
MSSASEDSAISAEEENEISEDEAPESVSFGKSRQDALTSISVALKETRRLKELKKEKRRNRHALLKQQRQSKIDLSSARLPESVLKGIADLDDAQSENKKVPDDTPRVRGEEESGSSDDEGVDDDDDDDDDDDELEEQDDFGDADLGDEDTRSQAEDYIAFEGFQAVPLSDTKHRAPSTKESALEFLDKHLYGARIHRESVNKHVSRLRKRDHKPALHFTKPGKKTLNKKRKKQMKKEKNLGSPSR